MFRYPLALTVRAAILCCDLRGPGRSPLRGLRRFRQRDQSETGRDVAAARLDARQRLLGRRLSRTVTGRAVFRIVDQFR